jgi:diguanylate cyclase (GGDEF)-like protein
MSPRSLPLLAVDIETVPASLADRYRVLLGIGSALAGVLSEEEIYATVHRETIRVLEADGFYVVLYDGELDEAEVVYWADRGQGRRSRIPFRGSDSEVLRTGRPVLVNDRLAARSLMTLGEDHATPTRSAISAPLHKGDEVVGCLSVQSYRPRAYGDAELELLQGVADVASVAVVNLRHLVELERRKREAERMLDIARTLVASLDDREVLRGIVDAALELLESDSSSVWLLEEAGARVGASGGSNAPAEGALFPLEGEVVRLIVEERESIILDDIASSRLLPPVIRRRLRSRSGLLVPLVAGDRVIGALSVGSAESRNFTPEEARLLQRLAGHAALALENARLHARLRALSLTDPLTDLPNRRHLELHLAQEFAAARRGRALAVVLFDVDYFKEFNDTLGHLAGDDALRAMGEILLGETRAMNLVARYGGDEFVAVLSDTDVEGAERHARRVSLRLSRHPVLGPLGLSVTAGVAAFQDAMEQVDDLLQAADQDLYRNKRTRIPRDSSRSAAAAGGAD